MKHFRHFQTWNIYLLFFYNILDVLQCFNIDTRNPVIYKGANDSYFGYTVALLKNNQGLWILVGAPKSTDEYQKDVESPGAVFKCSYPKGYSNDECQQVNIDDSGNTELVLRFDGKNVKLHHQKNNSWLGVSLDVKPDTMDSILVCAHRWRESYLERNVNGISHMNGLCYDISANFNTTGQLIPALTKWTKLVHADGYAMYSMGTLGTSAIYSEKGDIILMGAPGLNDGSGGLVLDNRYSGYLRYIEPPRTTYQSNYVGFSVTSGKFIYRGSYSVALGAPRARNIGKVLIYRFMSTANLPAATLEGTQLGSYFGASLCVVNYNNDHYDDLLVGAPMYAEDGRIDQGRVYVFVSMGPMGFRKTDLVLRGSGKDLARFGTALVNLGDINLDGYKDIAVGAPYEDDGHGAIYIYNGCISGLWSEFTQRISAKQLDMSLLGFGISFSRPYDMDQNGNNDVAVGSYVSGHAVLLRSRPVIDVLVRLEVSPRYIDPAVSCNIVGMSVPCVKVKICFFYSGNNKTIPEEIETNYTLRFDSTRSLKAPRAVLPITTEEGLQDVTFVSANHMIQRDTWDCSLQYTIYIRSITDKNEAISFELKFSPIEASNCEICPVYSHFDGGQVNPVKKYTIQENCNFLRNCGPDYVCHSNLLISGSVEIPNYGNQYILDETDNFSVKILLSNDGDLAYDTKLIITIPENIEYREVKFLNDSSYIIPCIGIEDEANGTLAEVEIHCVIGDMERTRYELVAELAAFKEFSTNKFKIKMKLVTSSTDLNEKQNTRELEVHIKRKSDIAISGAAVPDQLVIRSGHGYNVSNSKNLTHVYQLYNNGPNALYGGNIVLKFAVIPDTVLIAIDEKNNLDLEDCHQEAPNLAFVLHDELHREKQTDGKSTVNITCGSSFPCTTIRCPIGKLNRDEKIIYVIQIQFTEIGTWLSETSFTEQGVHKIKYISVAYFEYENNTDILIPEQKISTKVITDIIFPAVIQDDNRFHVMIIVIVSVVSGVLCLSTFSVLLWKCGFFKRQQRDDLQRLIEDRRQRLEISSETIETDEGSHENLVMIPPRDTDGDNEYGLQANDTVTGNGLHAQNILTVHRSTIFENNGQYLEPIQRLL